MSIAEKCMAFIKVAFDATMESSWMTLTAKSDSTLDLLLESPSTGERNFDFEEGVTTAATFVEAWKPASMNTLMEIAFGITSSCK